MQPADKHIPAKTIGGLGMSEPLECLADMSDRTWALCGLGELPDGCCYIVDATDAGNVRIAGYYDGRTGDVLACPTGSDAARPIDSAEGAIEPAVHVIGALDGTTGQVTVRQEQGNYLRICRWDRVEANSPVLQGAMLRTLPQCGCGGSLGTPKLFSSFAEMSAYHFCAFFLQ